MIDDSRAIFLQVAQHVEDAILDGSLAEESQAPSTNELAVFHRINPATAAKGISLLVERGVLYKQRGIGMFVTGGARELLLADRRAAFAERFLTPLLAEANSIGLTAADVAEMLRTSTSQGRPS